ncbi:MAG TPA: hypothetical protein VLF61_00010 [Rhabdochlamydiaceae bacterium]|nr:hypothetical protein [Rhabdochlamydiaceae bacterium]
MVPAIYCVVTLMSRAAFESYQRDLTILQTQFEKFKKEPNVERMIRVAREINGLITQVKENQTTLQLEPKTITLLNNLYNDLTALKEQVDEEVEQLSLLMDGSLTEEILNLSESGLFNSGMASSSMALSESSISDLLPTQEEINEIAQTLYTAGKISDDFFKAAISGFSESEVDIQIDIQEALPTPAEIAKIAKDLHAAGEISDELFIVSVSNAISQSQTLTHSDSNKSEESDDEEDWDTVSETD